jgi:hypothetical protein
MCTDLGTSGACKAASLLFLRASPSALAAALESCAANSWRSAASIPARTRCSNLETSCIGDWLARCGRRSLHL